MLQRRSVLAGLSLPLWGCQPKTTVNGGFVAQNPGRAHQIGKLQNDASKFNNILQRSTQVLIVGAGVAGLSAARALQLRGIPDFTLLELDDAVGGNSQGTELANFRCPMGAHYLPVPTNYAYEVQDFLEQIGVRQRKAGRWIMDEKHLCHSPQQRLFIHNHWQEGVIPLDGINASTLQQYYAFQKIVDKEKTLATWQIPVRDAHRKQSRLQYLASITFSNYLNQNSLNDPYLLWYLDYCCLDEYGANSNLVSAWAGIHYFASRNGFQIPGKNENINEEVLTWPEGNAWLVDKLKIPFKDRIQTARVVFHIEQHKHHVAVLALNIENQSIERWSAKKAIITIPRFVATKIVQNPKLPLQQQAKDTSYAPWLVANVHMTHRLDEHHGVVASWDNVVYGKQSLGYIDATHQLLSTQQKGTLITYYQAMGVSNFISEQRAALLQQPWSFWRDIIYSQFAECHPDLPEKARHIDMVRYGHAMLIPQANPLGKVGYSWNERIDGRIVYAHSDWAGYSIFEEAFTMGFEAGNKV
jgi:monoamine oxidase